MLTAAPLDWFLVFWCLLAFAATPIMLLRISPLAGRWSELGVAVGGVLASLLLLIPARRGLTCLRAWQARAPGFAVALSCGLLLRLGWAVLFPAQPASDGATYLELARMLVRGQSYVMDGTLAYWPVGYPLWLAAWLKLVGEAWAVLASQVFAYLLAIRGIQQLAKRLSGDGAAVLACWVFALWPNLWAQASVPEKEALVAALLPWVLLLVLDLRRAWWALAAGVALGMCILVQPGLQFLLPALLLLVFLRMPLKRAWWPASLLVLGAALVIAPWTARNLRELGVPVLVSTNGGSNLYRANNPLASGGYVQRGEVDLSTLGELDSDRQGRALALAWIRGHPWDFARLAVEKQLRFMGDDAASIFASLRQGGGVRDMRLYTAIKLLANAWWLLVWLMLAAAVLGSRRDGRALEERWLIWGWFYLFLLHSVFESAGKYHLPMIWVPCVLLACLLVREPEERSR